ncbi:MAG: hypothetical protein LC687_01490 [Actinobacteria bacterium]|nr:hypothetical protein [Actinomycetota bacterium]
MNYTTLKEGERFSCPVDEADWPYKFTVGNKKISGWPDKQGGAMHAFFRVPRMRSGIYTISVNNKDLGRYYIEGRA